MADEEFDDEIEIPQKSGNTKLLLIFGLLFVLSNGIWGAVIFMKEPTAAAATKPEAAKAQEVADAEGADNKLEDPLNKPGPVVPLEPFVVNLNESSGSHYLRTTLQLEIDKEESREHVEKRMVMIRDVFLTVLASKQLDGLQSTEDKEKLRVGLLAAARKLMSKRSVHAVYFTEFLTQ